MEKIIIYTDGGSRGNPGPAGIGVWIETLNKRYGETIGIATNNDAEYQALIFALKKCKALLGKQKADKEADLIDGQLRKIEAEILQTISQIKNSTNLLILRDDFQFFVKIN